LNPNPDPNLNPNLNPNVLATSSNCTSRSFRVAFLYSLWLQLTTRDPTLAPLVAALGLSNPLHAQAIGLFFLAVVMPALGLRFGIEPLGPCLARTIAPPPSKPPVPLLAADEAESNKKR